MDDEIKAPLVSVVCLTYNQERYIAETLEGFVRQQTNFPFEIIVHDDASTDSTPSIIATYAQKYPGLVRVILQRENQYSQNVRMPAILFAAARGELIAYCEGDDFWTAPNKLQMQVDMLRSRADVGVVFTDKNVLHQETGTLIRNYDKVTRSRIPTGDVRRVLLLMNPYCACTAMFRADLVKGYEVFAEKLNAKMDDWVMWLTIAKTSGVEYISCATATYRVLRESVSHSRSVFKNIRSLRSKYRISNYFNQAYGFILSDAAIKQSHHRDMLDRSVRFHKWRAAFNRKHSHWELFRCVVLHWVKKCASNIPLAYRLASMGRRAMDRRGGA